MGKIKRVASLFLQQNKKERGGKKWCRETESNRPRSALQADALPLSYPGTFGKLSAEPVEAWWTVQDLNLRPPRCKRGALAN